MKLKIKLLNERAILPTRGTDEAAGWDIYIPAEKEFIISPFKQVVINTGLSVEIPSGYYLALVPRSSISKKGLIIPNSPAIIDSDYRGEISIMVQNVSQKLYVFYPRDRIAQLILHKYEEIEFEQVEQLSETKRGTGGLGSTGR